VSEIPGNTKSGLKFIPISPKISAFWRSIVIGPRFAIPGKFDRDENTLAVSIIGGEKSTNLPDAITFA